VPSSNDVAKWMVEQFHALGALNQGVAAAQIRQTFGGQHTYISKNGNIAISPAVLREFRKMTEGIAVWERANLRWRKRTVFDRDSRQV
jgi:Family of unknown function (DUF6953)